MAVVTFEPLSREYFAPDNAPPRLMSCTERIHAFRNYAPDVLWMARFSATLAAMSARQFIEQFLVKALMAQRVFVGDDFVFGRGREGNIEMLREIGAEHGMDVWNTHTVTVGGERVSSTRLRQALKAGNFDLAEQLLGRRFSMYGRVVRGQQLGRTLGYPTANMPLRRKSAPVHGIFAVRVSGGGLNDAAGVASLGKRPTVGGTHDLLEVHVFDRDIDLYGSHLNVEFVAKLRDEEKFDDLQEMTLQMHDDAAQARQVLAAA